MSRFGLGMLVLLAALGCAREPRSEAERAGAVTPAAAAAPVREAAVSPAEARGPSIYELGSTLRDEKGQTRGLDAFRGHPVLVTMFYGSCATACPLLTTELKRIERRLPESARAGLRVLMVSFDEARDTPDVLARLKQERGMDATRWLLASAPDDGARELASVLGIRYRKLDDGEFFHSSVIVLLDAEGRTLVRLSGIGEDLTPVVAALTPPST